MPVVKVKIDGVWQDVAGIPTSGDADTLDGKHADEFAAASEVEELKELVGDTSVSEQISAHNENVEAHSDIRNAIQDLPISVADDGHTDINGLRRMTNWVAKKNDNIVTITLTFEGDVTTTDVITFNANGYPSSIISDGFEAFGTWTGFDDGGEA